MTTGKTKVTRRLAGLGALIAAAVLALALAAPGASAEFSNNDIPQANLIQYLQQELTIAGLYKGPIDNQANAELTAAIEAYQADAGLPITGVANAVTQMRLEKSLTQGLLPGVPAGSEKAAKWVKKLQTTLGQLKMPSDPSMFYTGPTNGVYQAQVARAVMLFQSCVGLPIDGLYGPQTRQLMQRTLAGNQPLLCKNSPKSSRSTAGVEQFPIPANNFVRYGKVELSSAGFFNGAINNSYTSAYSRAIENFQRSAGIPVNGHLNALTEMRLVKLLRNGSSSGGLPPRGSQVKQGWVKTLQQDLRAMKLPTGSETFYAGSVNSVYAGRTLQAVMLFEACAGLTIDGVYGPDTQQALQRTLVDKRPLACIGGPVETK